MEYGKQFGLSGGLVLFGYTLGYFWVVVAALVLTAAAITAIRYYFRRKQSLGDQ